MAKKSRKRSFKQGPSTSPTVSCDNSKKVFKQSGGSSGRATPPQVNRTYKPKGNP